MSLHRVVGWSSYAVVVVVLEWMAVAVITWGCVVACVPAPGNPRPGGGPTSMPERRLRRHARRGIDEIERYLDGQGRTRSPG